MSTSAASAAAAPASAIVHDTKKNPALKHLNGIPLMNPAVMGNGHLANGKELREMHVAADSAASASATSAAAAAEPEAPKKQKKSNKGSAATAEEAAAAAPEEKKKKAKKPASGSSAAVAAAASAAAAAAPDESDGSAKPSGSTTKKAPKKRKAAKEEEDEEGGETKSSKKRKTVDEQEAELKAICEKYIAAIAVIENNMKSSVTQNMRNGDSLPFVVKLIPSDQVDYKDVPVYSAKAAVEDSEDDINPAIKLLDTIRSKDIEVFSNPTGLKKMLSLLTDKRISIPEMWSVFFFGKDDKKDEISIFIDANRFLQFIKTRKYRNAKPDTPASLAELVFYRTYETATGQTLEQANEFAEKRREQLKKEAKEAEDKRKAAAAAAAAAKAGAKTEQRESDALAVLKKIQEDKADMMEKAGLCPACRDDLSDHKEGKPCKYIRIKVTPPASPDSAAAASSSSSSSSSSSAAATAVTASAADTPTSAAEMADNDV
jgi:hypothetical protein